MNDMIIFLFLVLFNVADEFYKRWSDNALPIYNKQVERVPKQYMLDLPNNPDFLKRSLNPIVSRSSLGLRTNNSTNCLD